jgi:hypothetical protein
MKRSERTSEEQGKPMGRAIEIEGIWVHAQTAVCVNHCRYCQLNHKRVANITFDRFRAVVERFMEWRQKGGPPDFKVTHWLGRSHNYDVKTLKGVMELSERHDWRLDLILLGGLLWRPDDEMRRWLRERQEIGIRSVVASFAGHGRFHDRWSGRPGDFDFLIRTQRVASQLGMDLHQRLFLTNSTIPLLDELIEKLDELLGPPASRCIYPLFYCGMARRMEDERVTRETLDGLPERIRKLYRQFDRKNWRSEQEWIDSLGAEEATPQKVTLNLELSDSNIGTIESTSCEAIAADLEMRTRAAYSVIPSPAELCERCGDRSNRRIYMFRHDMERKWLDLYLEKDPLEFERELTHLRA